jgi:hypothetical protein
MTPSSIDVARIRRECEAPAEQRSRLDVDAEKNAEEPAASAVRLTAPRRSLRVRRTRDSTHPQRWPVERAGNIATRELPGHQCSDAAWAGRQRSIAQARLRLRRVWHILRHRSSINRVRRPGRITRELRQPHQGVGFVLCPLIESAYRLHRRKLLALTYSRLRMSELSPSNILPLINWLCRAQTVH